MVLSRGDTRCAIKLLVDAAFLVAPLPPPPEAIELELPLTLAAVDTLELLAKLARLVLRFLAFSEDPVGVAVRGRM